MALANRSPQDRHGAEKVGLPPKGELIHIATGNPRYIAERAANCLISSAPPLQNRWFPLTLWNASPIPLNPVFHPGTKIP